MYGSDAMGGVLVFKGMPTLPEGTIKGNVYAEYQTNNGLFGGSFNLAGNQKGFTWDARYSEKHAHAYKNRFDGYVPNSQFEERAFSLKTGLKSADLPSWLALSKSVSLQGSFGEFYQPFIGLSKGDSWLSAESSQGV